jgi:Nucleotide modification associated domain 3
MQHLAGFDRSPQGWRPMFGQADAAQQHLANQGVGREDIFLFFGWFRDVLCTDGRLRYTRSPDRAVRPLNYHAIWGWMEIGDVLSAAKFATWHPWAINEHHTSSPTWPVTTPGRTPYTWPLTTSATPLTSAARA